MKLESTGLRLSATDLAQHLGCPHLTQLDRATAEGRLDAPVRTDPVLEMLKQRAIDHEAAYAAHLAGQGLTVAEVGRDGSVDRVAELVCDGTDVVLQPRPRRGGEEDDYEHIPLGSVFEGVI